MNIKFQTCASCGNQISEHAAFCSFCGKPQAHERIEQHDHEQQKNQLPSDENLDNKNISVTSKQKWWTSLIRSLISLALSVVVLVMAFLPVIKTESVSYRDFQFKIGAIDIVGLMFDSFYSLSAEELADTEIAEELSDLAEIFSKRGYDDVEDYEDLPHEGKVLCEKVAFLAARLMYQSEETTTSPSLIAAGVVSLLHILAAVLLTVFSLLYIASHFRIIPVSPLRFEGIVNALLILVPLISLVNYAAAFLTFHGRTQISAPVITTLSIGAAWFVTALVFNAISKKQPSQTRLVSRILSSIAAVSVIVTAFFPVMVCEATGIFKNRENESSVTINTNASFFTSMFFSESNLESAEINENQKQNEKEELLKDRVSNLFRYTVREVKNGEADQANENILLLLTSLHGLYHGAAVFGLIPLIYLLVFICAAIVLWQNLCHFTSGKSSNILSLICRILAVVFVTLALAAIIVFVAFMAYYMNTYNNILNDVTFVNSVMQSMNYVVYIGAGSICMTCLSVFMLCCPLGSKKRRKSLPRTYYSNSFYSIFDEETI